MFRKKYLMPIIPLALIGVLFASGCAGPGAQLETTEPPAAQMKAGEAVILNIESVQVGGEVIITIEGSQPLSYSMFKMQNPLRLAMDLPGVSLGEFNSTISVEAGPVSYIKPVFVEPKEGEGSLSRLEIFLSRPAEYDVSAENQVLVVSIADEETVEDIGGAGEVISAPVPVEVTEEAPSIIKEITAGEPGGEEEMVVAAAVQKEGGSSATRVTMLDVVTSSEGTQVIIEGDGMLEYEYFMVESRSLVVDIFNTANSIWPMSRQVADSYIKQIRIGEHFEPKKKVRVVIDLAQMSDYKIVGMGDKILVNFGNLSQFSDEELRQSLSNVVTDVYFRPLENVSILEVATTGEPEYQTVDSEDPNRLILEIANSRVTPEAQKTLDLTTLNREVSKVVSFQFKKDDQPVARVVLQFKEMVPYRIESEEKKVIVEVPRKVVTAPAAKMAQMVEKAPAAPAAAPAPQAVMEQPAVPAEIPVVEEVVQKKKYTGRKLSLDFKDADINDVLRLIADVSGINFVAGQEVKGRVTIKLSDVPWDQALDVILKTNSPVLTKIDEDVNIIRITTLENVRRLEEEKHRMEKSKLEVVKTQEQLEELVTRTFQISYAKVSEIAKRVENFMSDRKRVDAFTQFDDRTNTLIVRDLQNNVDEIAKVIKELDTPTPAVQIEARIVSVSSNYSRSLGIEWGFKYLADSEHGNATGFEFPNSISLGGTEGDDSNLIVNLPASTTTGGIGMSLGHIADTFNLDIKLSAGEGLGEVEILSNPKIFTVQNEEAVINVGSQLPVPMTDTEGNRTVEWKDVGILLKVTPQVTADNKVFMEVQVEASQKGEDVETTEGTQFSIDTRRAQTKVLLNDGETSVIGGLFQTTKSDSSEGLPWLSKIPILGWLFKKENITEDRDELLMFLTPRIVRPL